MSEDFDKEAERKRLREKYEADREDREATERMSELLLQGATMTNKHCDACGSPIFRYQGQEFCPSCQEERGGGAAAGEAATTGEGAEARSATGETAADQPATETDAAGDQAAPGTTQPSTGTAEDTATPGPESGTERPETQGSGGAAGQQTGTGSVEEARATLVRTLTNLARRAERTEDPRQAKELLAAAREAAETLARLRGN